MKKIIITYIFLITYLAGAQPEVEVYWLEDADTSIVNLGPCHIGDTLSAKFMIRNTGDKAIRIVERIPSIYVGLSPNDTVLGNQFQEFREILPSSRFDIPVGQEQILTINYIPFEDIISFPYGWKEALFRLQIGLVEDENNIIFRHEYFLRAKKTKLLADGYANYFTFDSVYVDPVYNKEVTWKIKSITDKPLLLTSQHEELISQQKTAPEFEFSQRPGGIMLQPGKTIDWQVSYTPKDRGFDTSYFYIVYYPDKDAYPDSTDRIWSYFYGFGAEQDIRLVECNYDVSSDTINIGNIKVGDSKTINCKVKNFGNIPFGVLGQEILDEGDETPSGFDIQAELMPDGHLMPDSIGAFSIECSPETSGSFIKKYVVKSDIITRNIHGVQASAKELVYYIKGTGLMPYIQVNADTIDYGNVFAFLPYCEASRDTTLLIKNNGNADLEIETILIVNQEPDEAFYPEVNQMVVPALSTVPLTLNFSPFLNGDFSADLLLVNNSPQPNDTILVKLFAASVRPVRTTISMDTVYAAPGRILEYPVRIDKENIIHALSFNDTIYFDETLLEYAGNETIGTASDGPLEDKLIEETVPGKLGISLLKPPGKRFLPSDTLIILRFRSYLGETVATKLSFTDPRFGDENCSRVLNIFASDGYFELDSICGLEYKAMPSNGNGHGLISISPNPVTDNINIEYEIKFKTNVSLNIYDSYGRIAVRLADNTMPAGLYEARADLSGLLPGVYFIKMQAGLYNSVEPIVITR